MEPHKANSKRIAKNMLILYFRMFFQMGVFFYTSRVLLAELGVTDFGIYDVVAGFVLVLSFLNNTMTSSTQRFVTFALGSNDERLVQSVFSISLTIHLVLAILVVTLGETIGLWYIQHHLQLPSHRLDAAIVVFHASLFVAFMTIFSVPYNAMIIAHEKMTAFAYITILDVSLKLLIVLCLQFFKGNKLEIYALLLAVEALVIRIVYGFYCNKAFTTAKFQWIKSHPLYLEMMKFAGWSIFGNLSYVANTQGTNILLNFLGGTVLGPIYNASRGVAFQIQTAINAFVSAFQTSINPQITKSYAQNELPTTHHLVLLSSRISFCLILIIILPLLIETPFFLQIWLKVVPPYAVPFTRLLIIAACIDAVANALCIAADATGNVKKFNLITSLFTLSTLPLGYISNRLTNCIEMIYLSLIFCSLCTLFVRLHLGRTLYGISFSRYVKEILCTIALLLFFCLSLPLTLKFFLPASTLNSLFISICCILWTSLGIYTIGLRSNERLFIQNKIGSMLFKQTA